MYAAKCQNFPGASPLDPANAPFCRFTASLLQTPKSVQNLPYPHPAISVFIALFWKKVSAGKQQLQTFNFTTFLVQFESDHYLYFFYIDIDLWILYDKHLIHISEMGSVRWAWVNLERLICGLKSIQDELGSFQAVLRCKIELRWAWVI